MCTMECIVAIIIVMAGQGGHGWARFCTRLSLSFDFSRIIFAHEKGEGEPGNEAILLYIHKIDIVHHTLCHISLHNSNVTPPSGSPYLLLAPLRGLSHHPPGSLLSLLRRLALLILLSHRLSRLADSTHLALHLLLILL